MSDEELEIGICRALAEAQAALDKYGEGPLSPEEEFLLEAECEAIAEKSMKNSPKVFEFARRLIAKRVLELFTDKEDWSNETKLEEFMKMQPKDQ